MLVELVDLDCWSNLLWVMYMCDWFGFFHGPFAYIFEDPCTQDWKVAVVFLFFYDNHLPSFCTLAPSP